MAKANNSKAVYPVRVLREQCTALEAALELALAKPRKKAVHQVRTTTRRIEAQFELLALLEPGESMLAGLGKRSKKVGKLLAGVRKAAGKVRDLDVQRALVKDAVKDGASGRVRGDARDLRRALKQQRADEADALLKELEGHALKLGPKLEKLLNKLEPAMGLNVSRARLLKLIEQWYGEHGDIKDGAENSLHDVRKAAKLARYMAEAGGAGAVAVEYEQLQETGGTWHDALTLSRVAGDQLGKKAGLVKVFRGHEETALQQFREHLEGFTPGNAKTKPRRRARG